MSRVARFVLPHLLFVTLALWFGGLIALFAALNILFGLDHDLGARAGPPLFRFFGMATLALGAVSIVATLLWRLLVACSTPKKLLLAFVLAATAIAVGHLVFVERPMNAIRDAGETGSPRWKQLHGISMAVYMGETIAVLAAGLALVSAIRREGV
jgi:hypothetical protein